MFCSTVQIVWTDNQSEGSIGEVRKLIAIIKEDKVKLVLQAMGISLHAATASVNLDEEEKALVEPVNMFSSPNQWSCFHNDVKFYMEACLVHTQSGLPAQILVINNHKFLPCFWVVRSLMTHFTALTCWVYRRGYKSNSPGNLYVVCMPLCAWGRRGERDGNRMCVLVSLCTVTI